MRNPLSDKIVSIQPSGIRKFFDIVSEMKDAISLGVGEPDFDTPWHIRDEGIYSLEKGRTFYTSNSGLKELREEICNYLDRRYQVSYDWHHETIVTVGGPQTNHGRLTAAVAAKFGLKCIIVAVGDTDGELSGNLLLDGIFGARVVLKHDDGRDQDVQLEETVKKVMAAELKKGEQVYFIPMGGSDTTGMLGYMDCARELDAQAKEQQIDGATVYVAVGSMGTYLGLYCGLKAIQSNLKLVGIAVMPFDMEKLKAYFQQAKEEYGFDFDGDFHVETGYIGKGYNEPEPRVREAIYTMARHEGILLDPCYTGKMFAGVLSMIKEKKIKLGRQVILLHTGGMPGLYTKAHRIKFENELKDQIEIVK